MNFGVVRSAFASTLNHLVIFVIHSFFLISSRLLFRLKDVVLVAVYGGGGGGGSLHGMKTG
jgi:hypothetical protein